MCGIAGFVTGEYATATGEELRAQLSVMNDALRHRGPNSSGTWLREDGRVGFAHRRLAILDLSENGRQPMFSPSERFVIVFNGEIYNHLELRKKLKEDSSINIAWKGHSDTETILACIERWGFEGALQHAVGMFALAVLDQRENILYLGRDRVGEKPLYYGWSPTGFVFGSELKALKESEFFSGEIDPEAITLQMRFGYIPAPYSIYKNTRKLSPGCFLKIPLNKRLQPVAEETYWPLKSVFLLSDKNSIAVDEIEAAASLERLLSSSIKQQMIADVPLGAFLSGGIDSSTVVSLMQAQSVSKVQTFSIGFEEAEFDEATQARAVAEHLGTNHTELYVSSQRALEVVAKLPTMFDEPFSDPSQIPTFLVSELAKKTVAVSLSGDGGDELFGGYNRYLGASKWWSKIRLMPYPIRRMLAGAMMHMRPEALRRLEMLFSAMASGSNVSRNWAEKSIKISKVLSSSDGAALYRNLISQHPEPMCLVIAPREPDTVTSAPISADNLVQYMMFMDAKSYLPDGVLTKLDRAAMAVSLETRVPFLDHRLVEFAAALPMNMKIRNGQGKWLLRQVLEKYVPAKLIDRPKMGFGVPIDSWLRGPLRDWAESLLNQTEIDGAGYLRAAPVRALWQDHLSGKKNLGQPLWNILMFQSWLDQQSGL